MRLFARLAAGRAFWIGVLATIACYLAVWLSHFRYVYGWLMDDRYDFQKGLATLDSFKGAFSGYNALQLYFFLISYLPLSSRLSIPSYPLPIFGEQTGQFRFFLLYTVFLHAGMLATWAWFARRVTMNPTAAFLSTLLLATSPTFTLWTPLPDSRLIGLPPLLLGLFLLFRSPTRLRTFFIAGTCVAVAENLHYTALYAAAPLLAVFWVVHVARNARNIARWIPQTLAFAAGLAWLHVLFEAISYATIRASFAGGPWLHFSIYVKLIVPRGHARATWSCGPAGLAIRWGHCYCSRSPLAGSSSPSTSRRPARFLRSPGRCSPPGFRWLLSISVSRDRSRCSARLRCCSHSSSYSQRCSWSTSRHEFRVRGFHF